MHIQGDVVDVLDHFLRMDHCEARGDGGDRVRATGQRCRLSTTEGLGGRTMSLDGESGMLDRQVDLLVPTDGRAARRDLSPSFPSFLASSPFGTPANTFSLLPSI